MNEKLWNLRKQLQYSRNLIHCITNPISINDCANAVLALGAKPIMAQHPMECEQVTAASSALALNLGNFEDTRCIAMQKSLICANEHEIPVILDLVGVGCSELRKRYALELLRKGSFSIIKGNLSELKTISGRDSHALGIDTGEEDQELPIHSAKWLMQLARTYNCCVLCSGETDIISDGSQIYFVENGDPMMTLCTGTGCMLNVIAAAYLSVADTPLAAALAACVTFELAAEHSVSIAEGPGSFHASLFDSLYNLKKQDYAEARIRRYV